MVKHVNLEQKKNHLLTTYKMLSKSFKTTTYNHNDNDNVN